MRISRLSELQPNLGPCSAFKLPFALLNEKAKTMKKITFKAKFHNFVSWEK